MKKTIFTLLLLISFISVTHAQSKKTTDETIVFKEWVKANCSACKIVNVRHNAVAFAKGATTYYVVMDDFISICVMTEFIASYDMVNQLNMHTYPNTHFVIIDGNVFLVSKNKNIKANYSWMIKNFDDALSYFDIK